MILLGRIRVVSKDGGYNNREHSAVAHVPEQLDAATGQGRVGMRNK